MHGAPVIEIEGLRATLRDRDRRFVLEAATLRIDAGAAFGLTGPSGAGKTLLLEILGLLRRPDPGGRYRLRLGGRLRDIGALWAGGGGALGALRGAAFGFVPQTGGLLPFLTLAENIALGPDICGRGDAGRIARLVERLDLGGLLALRPGQLSIGQRQRGAIAAALAHDPAVVIADEPTAALDPENAARGLGLILEAAAEGGAAVLVCSHDHALLARFALRRLALVVAEAREGTVVSRLDAGPEGLGCA